MAYQCSMRIQPLKMKDLKKVQTHNKREFIEKHVDADRSHLNRSFAGTGDLESDMQSVIDRYGMNDKRSTNVACEMILTAHHEWFEQGTQKEQEKRLREWVERNVRWLRKKYGDALVSCDLHLDEKAPHLHVVIAAKATYTKRFRHGEKKVTRIAYNKVFGDTAAVISKARKENNSELTKTGRLQSEYAEAMNPLGLERGTYNAFAVHQKTSEWRAIADVDPAAGRPKPFRPNPKPDVGILGKKEIEQWADREVAKAHQYVKSTLAYAVQKEAEGKKGKVYEKNSKAATRVISELRDNIRVLESEVKLLKDLLSKEQIGTLRKIPVERVAQSCNYTGVINPKKHRNAIDFLMDTENMQYNDAIVYLNDIFSSEEAQDTIRQFYADAGDSAAKTDLEGAVREQAKNGIRLSHHEHAISQEIERQLIALDADEYHVTLTKEGSAGKSGDCIDEGECSYSNDELLDPKVVRMLNVKNHKNGYNVFVTAHSRMHDYVIIDNMTAETKRAMERDGYTFAVVSEAYSNSLQGVLKITDEGLSAQKSQAFSRMLNEEHVDLNVGTLLHLAGFQNMSQKPHGQNGKHIFVTLKEYTGRICNYAKQKLKEVFSQYLKMDQA
ncbi:RepB DNA-primase [Mariprofundus aestuarium]|uniref:RepB DNA-primase n=2 Tax=Mariprofundus aestuarium TaxID=1921086 RepID=A0A2K8L4G4_MARES|nr:MobV family relaxase [Mariprofundus aestuarium]ATX79126.1 RepB DNA-primase [Mariprofundus aestuarium]